MKKQLYWITAVLCSVICLVCTSCEDHSSVIPPVDQTGGEGYFSINLSTSSTPATKAPVTDIDPWEHRVDKVWVLLYNTDKLAYKFVYNVKNYQTTPSLELINFTGSDEDIVSGSAQKTGFKTVAQSVKRQQYKMAVLANPSETLFAGITIDSPLSELTKVFDGGGSDLAIEMFGGYQSVPASPPFFMSNANGLITVSTSDLYSTKEDAQASPVKIYLDRLLAKVIVKEKDGGVIITTPNVVLDPMRPLRWYLDVTNKSTFFIRQFALLKGGAEMETETNSTTTNRENIYATDPNFILSGNSSSQFKVWNRTTDNIPYSTWVSKSSQDPALGTYQYTFENTLDRESQRDTKWADYTTRITLKTFLIYKDLLWNASDLNNTNDPNRNYYSFLLDKGSGSSQWRVFTQEQAALWLDRGFPYIEQKSVETPQETAYRIEENSWVTLMETIIRKIQQDYISGKSGAFNFATSQHPGTAENLYRTYEGVTYHPLGLNYYNIPVRHFGGNSANPREVHGYYGVVRNNMYTVTINSIAGPGNGIYDWDNRFLSAEISITPWYKRDFQSEDLKYE